MTLPKLVIRTPSLDEEFSYITQELIPKQELYKKAGYSPLILDKKFIKNKKEFSKVYRRKDYMKSFLKVKNIRRIWRRILLSAANFKDINFKIYPIYEVRLTLYGTGGDYFPSYGAFDGKYRKLIGSKKTAGDGVLILIRGNKQGNFVMKPEEVVIHEFVHLGIENFIRKNKISHKEKERIVNDICEKHFKIPSC